MAAGVDTDYEDSARPEVVPFVPAGVRVLDVGCWKGGFGTALKVADPTCTVWGVETRPEAVRVAERRLDHVVAGLFPAAMSGNLAAERFDCITFLDVLEHMVDPWSALRSAREFLTPGGVCIASIPNVRNIRVVAPLVRGHWDYRDAGILDRTHLRFFTRSTMVKMFEGTGYTVRRCEPINFMNDGRMAGTLRLFGRRTAEFRAMQYLIVAGVAPLTA